jgi:hypothetical protein
MSSKLSSKALAEPHLAHSPSLPETHLLRCSPYIYVQFVYLSQFSGGFTLAEFGVSRHRLNYV